MVAIKKAATAYRNKEESMACKDQTILAEIRLRVRKGIKPGYMRKFITRPPKKMPAKGYRYFEVRPKRGKWEEVILGKRFSFETEEFVQLKPADKIGACKQCGAKYLSEAPFCSGACYQADYRDRHPKAKTGPIHCDHCGEDFQPVRSTARFCSVNCRVAANRAKSAKTKSTKKKRVRAK
jgi:hypothetical protein